MEHGGLRWDPIWTMLVTLIYRPCIVVWALYHFTHIFQNWIFITDPWSQVCSVPWVRDTVRCHPDVPSGRTCCPGCPSGTGSPKIIPLGGSPHPMTQKHRNIKTWPCGPIANQLWLDILAPELPWGLWAEAVSLDLHHHSTSPSVCSYICPLPSIGVDPHSTP